LINNFLFLIVKPRLKTCKRT